jgi:class 3 adenylate cyclase/pimeloyl-ACP methyl ester carboxylesterase
VAELPSGTVTFLFTDLEGSTRLWEEHPNAMRGALARHDAILLDAVAAHDGHVVKTTGDGLHAVFATAIDATAAAIDGQQHLLAEGWPLPKPLRVRMGLHTGHAEIRDGDYYGPAVNRAARVAAAPHGGQIVMSHATEQLTRDALPPGCALMELGEHHLRDLGRAEVLFQLLHPDLPRNFAPLRTSSTTKRQSPRLLRLGAIGLVLVAVAGGVVALALSGEGSENAVPAIPRPRGYVPVLADRSCKPDEAAGDPTVRCATLTVPENRGIPKARAIHLAVIRARASGRHPLEIPTIVVGEAIGSTAGDPLRSTSDQIRVAMRGRDGSDPELRCLELDQSRQTRFSLAWRQARELGAQMLGACLTRLHESGLDLRHYSAADVADDVRDLAFALGAKQVNLQAFADTARVAVAAMRRYPGLLRAVLLASPLVPPTSAVDNEPSLAEGSLSLLAQRCRADMQCKTRTPDLVESVERLRRQLADQPAIVTVSVENGQQVRVVVDDGRFMMAVYGALDNMPSIFGVLPAVVESGDMRGPAALLVATAPYVDRAVIAIERCAEDAGTVTATQVQGQAAALPRWQSLVDPSILALCDRFGLKRVPDVSTAPTSDTPVFVVNGSLTPFAPTSAMTLFGAGLSHFKLLTLPNKSVGFEGWPSCVHKLRAQFLRNPEARLAINRCAASDPPVPFVNS